MTNELANKVILLTGATEGIGKSAAKEFAARGAELVLVARNPQKGEKVVAELKESTGNPRVSLLVGDLSVMADVRRVAGEFRAAHDRLDVLVNNAGAVFTKRQLSADGLEQTFALNHVGYFLLTHELAEVLGRTPGARVVSTSSGAHQAGKIRFDEIAKREGGYSGFPVYCDSKLANVLFTRELARRLAPRGVTANCVHPGFVNTGFGHNTKGLVDTALKFLGPLFARSPEKGAETVVWAAVSPDAAKVTGEYLMDRKVARSSKLSKDEALARELWAFSERICAIA